MQEHITSAAIGQRMHKVALALAPVIVATYTAGLTLGLWVHQTNDQLAALWVGLWVGKPEQEPEQELRAAVADLVDVLTQPQPPRPQQAQSTAPIALHTLTRVGDAARVDLASQLQALTVRQLQELTGLRAKRSKAHYVARLLAA